MVDCSMPSVVMRAGTSRMYQEAIAQYLEYCLNKFGMTAPIACFELASN